MFYALLTIFAAAVAAVDQWTKVLAQQYLTGTTVTISGMGSNGGLKYDHLSGVAVRNADTVVPVVFGGPESLAKVYDTEVGEYGQIVGPKLTGLAEQWTTLAWKWYGGYDTVSDNRIVRAEVASSMDA